MASLLRFPMSHYDRYVAPCVRQPVCRACGAENPSVYVGWLLLCATCAQPALRLIDVTAPYERHVGGRDADS